MRQRKRTAALLVLVLALGLCAWGNESPMMEDQALVTLQDTPLDFDVAATDPDIDPKDPEAHPLAFLLLEGPSHGVLIGDFARVTYIGPHQATIELTYVPAAGYVGEDIVKISVVDPFNKTAMGTTTIRIDVTPKPLVGMLSGVWDTELAYNVQSGTLSALRTRVTETYRVDKLTLKAIAEWKQDVLPKNDPGDPDVLDVQFESVKFDGSLRLDWLSLTSTLAFDPTPPQANPAIADFFEYWRATARHSLVGVNFVETFYLGEPGSSYFTLSAAGDMEWLRWSGTTTIGFVDETCQLGFERQVLSGAWSLCGMDFTANMELSTSGFGGFNIKLNDYTVPYFSWGDSGVFLDIDLAFKVDSLTLTPSLELRTSWIECFRIYGEVLTDTSITALTIDGFSIYGIRLRHTFENGVRLVTATAFDGAAGLTPNHNSQMTGQADYFEMVSISGTTMSCCARPGTWRIATYFQKDHTSAFSWGMTEMEADFVVGNDFSISVGVVYRTGGFGEPNLELSAGWKLRW